MYYLIKKNKNTKLLLPDDSNLEAVFTVSPNRQYLGIVKPTTPAQHDPIITKDNTLENVRVFLLRLFRQN